MSGLIFLLWFGNVFFDTVGQLSFKAAAVDETEAEADKNETLLSYWKSLLRRPFLWLGILSYIAEFLLWLAFLTMVPLTEGVLLGSVNIIIIMILGRFFFREILTPLRVAGILLIFLGVAAVGSGDFLNTMF